MREAAPVSLAEGGKTGPTVIANGGVDAGNTTGTDVVYLSPGGTPTGPGTWGEGAPLLEKKREGG